MEVSFNKTEAYMCANWREAGGTVKLQATDVTKMKDYTDRINYPGKWGVVR